MKSLKVLFASLVTSFVTAVSMVPVVVTSTSVPVATVVVAIASVAKATKAEAQNSGQYNKILWNPSQDGMGIQISHQVQVETNGTRKDIIFGTWFHYAPDGSPVWLTFICNPMVKDTLLRDSCTSPLYRVRGNQPMGYNPNNKVVTTAGTMSIAFNSVNSAIFTYSFDAQNGTINLEPQIFASDATALHYTDKVIAIKDGGYPHMVTKTGAVKVVNKTSYTLGFLPLFSCDLGSPQLTDGKVLTRCTNAVATANTPVNSRVVSYVNPVTGEQFDFTGTVPANIIWKSVENNSDKPEWSAKARVSDGWFFTPFDATTNLRFQADTGVITNIQTGGDNFKVMVAYTN